MIMHSFIRWGTILLLHIALLGATAAGQAEDPPKKDAEKTQKVAVSGVEFEVPATWKSQPPASAMRKAQLRFGPVDGDKEPAELVLFVFPGGAGGVEANIERWRMQFTDDAGDNPKVESTKVKGKNLEVTRVEIAGTFKDPFAGGGPRSNYRLYGAIATTDDSGYFFKMIGPEKTMKAARAAFDQMLITIKTD
jgi:hypothetical protein